MITLVDLSAIFYRNWHGSGESGPEAYSLTLEHMGALVARGDRVVICCEGKNLIRAGYYPAYKANREAKPPALLEALDELIRELSTWDLYVLAVDGYEADDLIHTIAKHATEPVLILSSDKDLYSCITETVTMLARGAHVGIAECVKKFGVRPDQIRDFLCLVGDAADNIPGCPNCGPGRAATLLQKFGTVEALKAAPVREIEKIRGIGKTTLFSIREWDPSLALRLTTLLDVPDLPTSFDQGPLAMADMKPITTTRKAGPLRILAYGPEGVGKTRFAAFASKPIFVCAENGLSATDLRDTPAFPAPDTWTNVLEAVEWLRTNEHEHRTLVLDSLDWLYQLIKVDVCEKQNMTLAAFEEFGRGDKFTFDRWVKLNAAMDALQEERGMHIIAIAHSATKVFQNPAGEDFMRYQLDLNDKANNRWKQWPDFLLFMSEEIYSEKTKGDRGAKGVMGAHQIYTSRTAAFDAKSRILLPAAIPYETANPFRAFSLAVRDATTAAKPIASVQTAPVTTETVAA